MPKVSDVRSQKFVSNILLANTNKGNYISDIFLPSIAVKDDKGDIPRWGNAHMRVHSAKRALWDESDHRIEYEIDTSLTYNITDYDLESYIPDKLLRQQESPFALESQVSLSTTENIMLIRDNALAAKLTSTSILTQNTTLSGTSQWSDKTNSTPYADIETGKTAIFDATGKEANSAFLSREVLIELKQHPDYNSDTNNKAIGRGDSEFINILKDKHGLDNIFIGRARKLTSNEGQSTDVLSSVFNKDFVLFYRTSAPSIMEPSFGYSFVQKDKKLKVTTRRELKADKGILKGAELSFDDKILMPTAAYLIKDAVA